MGKKNKIEFRIKNKIYETIMTQENKLTSLEAIVQLYEAQDIGEAIERDTDTPRVKAALRFAIDTWEDKQYICDVVKYCPRRYHQFIYRHALRNCKIHWLEICMIFSRWCVQIKAPLEKALTRALMNNNKEIFEHIKINYPEWFDIFINMTHKV